jgi:hypothetical protein
MVESTRLTTSPGTCLVVAAEGVAHGSDATMCPGKDLRRGLRYRLFDPWQHKLIEGLLRLCIEIGTQKGLDFELSFKIAHQDPVQGYSD